MRAALKILVLGFVLILLVGCAVPKLTVPAQGQKRQGIFGVVYGQQAESGRFIWVQMDARYSLELYGPLGLGATELTQTTNQATLKTAEGKTYQAKSPEALLKKVLGWSMPISGMTSWIWAEPIPTVPFTAVHNSNQQLTELNQDGWIIHYTWQSGGLKKIIMERTGVRVTLVINS